MAITAILHFSGEDAIVGDMDELPDATQQFVVVRNPRRKDGKRVSNIEADAKAILYPLARITFIELMDETDAEMTAQQAVIPGGTTIFGFFREDDEAR
ncbi:MAG TPA: hypothetical protein VGR16_07405 [Thermomicrobiales bacterium]|nr:hypothetical protein [Thermomicrobiales bacterium]